MTSTRSARLRTVLAALLVASTLVTFLMVGGAILAVRVPAIERQSTAEMARATEQLKARLETLLGAFEGRITLLAAVAPQAADPAANALLDKVVGDGRAMRAIYLVSPAGIVEAAGVAPTLRARRDELIGADLSANPLFRAATARSGPVWSDKYLSALSGSVTVGVAHRQSRGVILAEVPLAHVLESFALAAGQRIGTLWLVDRSGEIVADTEGGRSVGTANLFSQPMLRAAREGRALPETFTFGAHHYRPAVSRSRHLEWSFVGGAPTGLENPDVRETVLFVGAVLLGTLLTGLLLAPFWAAWIARPLDRIVERAGQLIHGATAGPWPRGAIVEFNALAKDLENMATALVEREQKVQAIFNTTPVPMAVVDIDQSRAILDVNDAWCREFGYRRDEVVGKLSVDFGLWRSPDERKRMIANLLSNGRERAEAILVRRDGSEVLCQNHGSIATVGDARLLIWASVDIGDLRRIGDELRSLNADLEARVASRTADLAGANAELAAALESLRDTQGELVRAEKMAALGSLVAGVAHELNTPLGNSLLATTSLTDEVQRFKASMDAGIKRSALERLISNVEQAADITTRNLQRAADLVTSFKQVAVDQTSSQRRRFELAEVVGEMVKSLMPSLRRTPFRIDVQVPEAGLMLDSFPGPLGQTIANLVNNAVLHAFDGRAEGNIRVGGARDAEGMIVLTVADDGRGIPAALIGRIFDPFVTSKMGRGGSGLGLHIAWNAVTNILGGTLTVQSTEGRGATFSVRLPPVAPRAEPPSRGT